MKKRLLMMVLIAISATTLFAAGRQSGHEIKIGIAMSSSDEFNTNLRARYEAHARTLDGVTVVFTSAGGLVSQQLTDVENLISQGCNVIVLRAVDGDAVVTAMDSVRRAGIPLVIDETRVGSMNYNVRVSGDQIYHGRLLGEHLQDLVKRGVIDNPRIGYIAGLSTANILRRMVGIQETCTTATFVAGGAQGFALANNWSTSEAQTIVENWISSGLINQMNVIAAMNDELANAAIAALGGRFPHIIVLGVDGSAIGQQNIRNGRMNATTFQNNARLAAAVLDVSVALARGENIVFDNPTDRIVDPRHVSLMTRDNIDQLLR